MADFIETMTRKLAKEQEKKYKKLHEDVVLVWQNKELRFDTPCVSLGLRRGEVLIDLINGVEDTKGNNGERGIFAITNLRVIWFSERSAKTNLSIGYDCVSNIEIKNTKSKLRGTVHALHLRNRYKDTRYEFIFTSLLENSPRLFTSFQATVRSYDSSRLFRDFKIRGAIIRDRELLLLPGEQVNARYPEVWNVTSDQGNVGVLFLSNIRVVWFSNMSDSFNISLPFVQMKSIKKKENTGGAAMVIETAKLNGGYVLGFRAEAIDEITKATSTAFRTAVEQPVLGVEVSVSEVQRSVEQLKQHRVFDDIQIVEPHFAGQSNASASYMVSESKENSDIIFSSEIGLAIERPPNNISILQLWRVI